MGPWWDSEQPEPFQMYAQQGQQVRPQLPAGHPSNMLMWLRDQIPQVQADDTSLASGITSRLGRTATAIPRAGLETAANWLRGVNDPNAVRIGEDTIAPLGLFGMAGLAARAPRAAATAARSDAAIARDLAARYPEEIAGGSMSRQAIAGGPRMGVVSDEGMTPLTLTRDAMHGPGDFVNRAPPLGRPANLMADNAKSSVPGTVVSVADQRRQLDDLLAKLDTQSHRPSGPPPQITRDPSLDMSQEARMARAQEQGFDTNKTYYHGTRAAFDEFKPSPIGNLGPGVYVSPSARFAGDFARGDGANILPLHVRGEMMPDGEFTNLLLKELRPGETFEDTVRRVGADLTKRGYAGVQQGDVINVFDPSNIRSTQAAFDPAQRGSSNLLAANPSASSPGLAANSTQQDDNPVLSILSKYGLVDDYSLDSRMQLGGPGSFKAGAPSSAQKTVFAGTQSATADQAALAEAKELKSMNESPEEIRRTTGWFQREDGVWRNEIDDSQSKLKALVDKPGERKLSDVLDHPDLFAAYPQLKDVRLVFSNMKDLSGQAATSPMADFRAMQPWTRWGKKEHLVRINLNSIQNKDPQTARDIIIHEVQHAIQDIEGDLTQDVMNKNALVPYKNRLYEREGFDAQRRAGLSKSERRDKPPIISSSPGRAANATQDGPDEATLAILRQYGIIQ